MNADERHERLEEIAASGDAVEWLRMLKHESTRANNAELFLRETREVLARCRVELQYVRDGMVGHVSAEGIERLDTILAELRTFLGPA